jgi:hypothetical protein
MADIYARVLISYDREFGSRDYRGSFRGSSIGEIQNDARQFAMKYLHAIRITAIEVEDTTQA